jgi:hypothetical protein
LVGNKKRVIGVQHIKESEETDPQYPFIGSIKKMAYAFGDVKEGLIETYRAIHDFLKAWYYRY